MTSPVEDRPFHVPVRGTKILAALGRVASLGSTAQASVPGAYAWFVTVAPVAFAHGSPSFCRVVAACGVVSLATAPIIENKRPMAARVVSVWGLVSTSLLVWVAAPSASLSPSRIDVVRGLAGMLGWGLFAVASAAPARPSSGSAAPALSRAIRSPAAAGWWDAATLWIGCSMAGLTQAVGWRVVEPERAVLVRLLGLSGGLLAVGVAVSIVAARHVARKYASPSRRARRALIPLVFFGLLAAGGVVVTLAR